MSLIPICFSAGEADGNDNGLYLSYDVYLLSLPKISGLSRGRIIIVSKDQGRKNLPELSSSSLGLPQTPGTTRVGFVGRGPRSCTAFPVSLVRTAIVPLVSAAQGLLDTGLLQSDGHGRFIGQGPYKDHWNLKTKLGQGHIRSRASLHLYSGPLAISH